MTVLAQCDVNLSLQQFHKAIHVRENKRILKCFLHTELPALRLEDRKIAIELHIIFIKLI